MRVILALAVGTILCLPAMAAEDTSKYGFRVDPGYPDSCTKAQMREAERLQEERKEGYDMVFCIERNTKRYPNSSFNAIADLCLEKQKSASQELENRYKALELYELRRKTQELMSVPPPQPPPAFYVPIDPGGPAVTYEAPEPPQPLPPTPPPPLNCLTTNFGGGMVTTSCR